MIISGWRKMIISKNDNFVNSKMIIQLILAKAVFTSVGLNNLTFLMNVLIHLKPGTFGILEVAAS